MLAVVIIGIVGGLLAVCLYERGSAAGADAYAYWQGVHEWLRGSDPYHPSGPWWPYVYAYWMLPAFLPWAMLPWWIAWPLWRGVMLLGFGWSVAWAYRRRPLGTALALGALSAPIGVVLDSGNVSLFLVLLLWLAQAARPRISGFLWAFATTMKWIPVVFWLILRPAARRWGLGFLAVSVILSLVTWSRTLEQLRVVATLGVPHAADGLQGLRLDHLVFVWAAIPWLWRQPLRRLMPVRRLRIALRRAPHWVVWPAPH